VSHEQPLEKSPRRSSAGTTTSDPKVVSGQRRCLLKAISVALLVLGFHGTAYASEPDCFNVEVNVGGWFKELGCEKRKVGPNQGFCATAKEFIVRDLQPGEQMCCTADKAIVQQVPPKGILVCNATEAKVLCGRPDGS
jgi:hypothetical protein